MNQEIIKSDLLGAQIYKITHKSGLQMLLCPMPGFSGAYAMFSADIGSVDMGFRTQAEPDMVEVPAGVAHFLEHKMFENEDGDAFEKYAKTGASANAFTSFDKTSYLFACTDRFEESLEILLDFVRRPYFTEQSVQKEQGIIGQEIRMYDDSGDWKVMFNLLEALYHNHPVRVDIAGTTDSIAEITPELLYRCHRTFYSLENMVLCVAGNFDVNTVLRVADKVLKADKEPVKIIRKKVEEPDSVCARLREQRLSVASPLFQLGFKGVSTGCTGNLKNQVLDEILADVIAGDASPLYRRLYDEGLINSTFDSEVMAGRDMMCAIFSGESRDPKRVAREICEEIRKIERDGIDKELFELCRRAAFGRYIGMYTRTESVASLMTTAHFAGIDNIYSFLDMVSEATIQQMEERLKIAFLPEKSALSIVWPVQDQPEE